MLYVNCSHHDFLSFPTRRSSDLFLRVVVDDPVQEWREHGARLKKRMEMLNAKRFYALHFRGPGMDLIVGMARSEDTSLNSSHLGNSYAVFCLKKKKK